MQPDDEGWREWTKRCGDEEEDAGAAIVSSLQGLQADREDGDSNQARAQVQGQGGRDGLDLERLLVLAIMTF